MKTVVLNSLKKSIENLSDDFKKITDVTYDTLTLQSKAVLDIILRPESHNFSKEVINTFYEQMQDRKSKLFTTPTWIDSQIEEPFLPLIFLNRLYTDASTLNLKEATKRSLGDASSAKGDAIPPKNFDNYQAPRKKVRPAHNKNNPKKTMQSNPVTD